MATLQKIVTYFKLQTWSKQFIHLLQATKQKPQQFAGAGMFGLMNQSGFINSRLTRPKR